MTKLKKLLTGSLVASAVMLSMALPTQVNADAAKVKAQLQQMIGDDAKGAEITKSPVDGLYQVQLGLTVVYMSADGQHMLNGSMIDVKTNKDLTSAAQAKTRKAMMAKLDEKDMIVYPADKPKHTITVFTDIDCPYCRKLHNEIPALNDAGVTVRYLAFPRSGVMDRNGQLTKSYLKSVSVWCADDRAKVMDDAMNGLNPEPKKCDNPVISHLKQTQEFNVNGTPNIIFDDGRLVGGYAPAKDLIEMLNEK